MPGAERRGESPDRSGRACRAAERAVWRRNGCNKHFCQHQPREDKCNYGQQDRESFWARIHYGLYWKCEIQNLSAVFLPGKSGADRKTVQYSFGICRADGKGNCLGSVLWNRNDFSVSGPEGKTGLWRGNCASGH